MTYKDYTEIIKRNVPAEKVVRNLGIPVNHAGFCKCPFHADKTASMKLYPGSRGFYCFGCHAGGSVIDFVMAYYGVDMKNAVRILNEEFNLRLPIGREQTAEEKRVSEEMERKRKDEAVQREKVAAEKRNAYLRWCDLGKEISDLQRDAEDYSPDKCKGAFHPKYQHAVLWLPQLLAEAADLELIFLRKEEKDG